ncbi:hypothetical protein V2E38_10990 [Bifidobacterium longum subsp. infantis]|uniref:hypothetical protein n=1 Tax=Bifidobacterium longum TaxID=216816 RepID=UPI002EBD6795|nr:hypothetical protein [Bifidobacterium longum subsp. infantis]
MGFMSDMIVLATQDAGGGGVTPGAPANVGMLNTDVVCRALDCLPVERWATATLSGTSREDFASRIVNMLNFTDTIGNSLGHMMNALGNGMWALAANLADGGVLGGSDRAIAVAARPRTRWRPASTGRCSIRRPSDSSSPSPSSSPSWPGSSPSTCGRGRACSPDGSSACSSRSACST